MGLRRIPLQRVLMWLLALASLVALVLVRFTAEPHAAGPGGKDPQSAAPTAPTLEPGVVTPIERSATDGEGVDLDGLAFDDVTDDLGLTTEPSTFQPRTALQGMTSGVAVTRLGGRLTLLLTSPSGPVRLLGYDGSRFVDITSEAGLDGAGRATAAGFADLDADGDEDLVLGRQEEAVVHVFVNDGSDRFRNATRKLGVASQEDSPDTTVVPATRGVAFADVNGDGRLDFLTTDWNAVMAWAVKQDPKLDPDVGSCRSASGMRRLPPSGTSQGRLWLGTESGRFRDATDEWGLRLDPVFAFTPQFVDLDHDAWQDLLLTGDVCSSRILRNDGGTGFEDITQQTRATMTPNGMGSLVRDFNRDGEADWFVTGIRYPTASGECPYLTVIAGCSGNRLYLGKGDGTFREATDDLGLRDGGWGWGVVGEDFANSGDFQVAVTNGFMGADDTTSQWGVYYDHFDDDPMSFFVRTDDGFVDVAQAVGLDDVGIGHALVALDFDEDGRRDLLVNNADTGPRLYRNVTETGGRHWITVRLEDEASPSNRSAWGARVRVTDSAGHATDGWMSSSSSYETSGLAELHVGLGVASGDVTLEVWWPGATRPSRVAGVAVDRFVTLRRGGDGTTRAVGG